MSSIRNAVQRRVHRERAQPKERQRLGLLEKHKDYSLRAKDFNKKKAQLRALRQKAADRNEDEFYFGMMSRKGPGHALSQGKRWSGTVNGDRGNKAMDVDTVRLLKTQDVGYIRTVRSTALKEVKGLEERVIGLGGSVDEDDWEGFDNDDEEELGFGGAPKSTKAKKIVFTEGAKEREEILQQKETDGEDMDVDGDEDGDAEKNPEALRAEQRQKLLEKLQRRLQNARKKLRILTRTEHQLELQRAGMAKTATSMNGVTKSGKKFKVRERKR
ncbi:U3 small nucleolar RNA-associated protein 11 [Annulohypoxylon truncatum]|uniref:U3 small nucleolar RNA-associated protein 11 n=1 Tax=Annulohypoxylon truncatum TaxID=327061 RepID=UPI00200834AD|nr:U3 small nucleolar RNA-associated protein 11 [Annulohypoxylon truncatum]KAI1209228.1 U3 small nucleolar RNA-associated protein 11 [Annulohypoxylon truncatum]